MGSRGGRSRSSLPGIKRSGSATSAADGDDDAGEEPSAGSGASAARRVGRPPRQDGGGSTGTGGSAAERALAALNGGGQGSGRGTPKNVVTRAPGSAGSEQSLAMDPGGFSVTGTNVSSARAPVHDDVPGPWENRLKKAGLPPAMAASAELRELAATIQVSQRHGFCFRTP